MQHVNYDEVWLITSGQRSPVIARIIDVPQLRHSVYYLVVHNLKFLSIDLHDPVLSTE